MRRRWKWLLLIIPAALVILVVGGTFVYIHFIAPDPAPEPTFSRVSPGASSASGAGDASATAVGAIDGTWNVSTGSFVQYRVQEKLNGQDNEATGKTTAVTGQLAMAGTAVGSASFSVDMTKVTSDEQQRDSQFRGRIMNTSTFKTASFALSSPIELTAIPDNLTEITVSATGQLTLHGTTKPVTFDVQARRNGAQLEVKGTIPITFSDYGINNPSGGPARVGNSGDLEFLLIFRR